MKKIPLLPRYFRWIGLGFIILFISLLFFRSESDKEALTIKTFVLINDTFWGRDNGILKISEVDISLTIYLICLLLGLVFIAFSKTKLEDEMINSLRLYSWSWAIILMVILTILCTVFVYGQSFLVFTFWYPGLFLMAFIVIFWINIWNMNRRLAHEE